MKRNGFIFVIVILSSWLVACQDEEIPPTKEVRLPPAAEEVAENPPSVDPENDEEIIDETSFVSGADEPTPEPTPTLTPTPTPNTNEDSGSGTAGGGGGATSGSHSFTNVTINSGTYDGAILETQFSAGGGNAPKACLRENGAILSFDISITITIDDYVSAGCALFDGSLFMIGHFDNGETCFSRPINEKFGLESWNDNALRMAFTDFDSYENIKLLFYEKGQETNSLIGWQNIQVDSNGFYLMQTNVPFPLDDTYIIVERANGDLLLEAGCWISITPLIDSDDDGLNDDEELTTYGTDPQNRDSDGDGRSDGDEVAFGTDPNTTMNAQDVVAVGLADGSQFYREYNTEFPWAFSSSEGDFYFEEDRRGPWGIFLYDLSRDLRVHLDFWTKEMSCNDVVCGTVDWVNIARG